MTSRERLLTALENGRPDSLPCQVHSWMPYYLENYLGGIDQYAAYERFGLDSVVYVAAMPVWDEKQLANWRVRTFDLGRDEGGNYRRREEIETPKGILATARASNEHIG